MKTLNRQNLNNRANQLNPNNIQYYKSRVDMSKNNSSKPHTSKPSKPSRSSSHVNRFSTSAGAKKGSFYKPTIDVASYGSHYSYGNSSSSSVESDRSSNYDYISSNNSRSTSYDNSLDTFDNNSSSSSSFGDFDVDSNADTSSDFTRFTGRDKELLASEIRSHLNFKKHIEIDIEGFTTIHDITEDELIAAIIKTIKTWDVFYFQKVYEAYNPHQTINLFNKSKRLKAFAYKILAEFNSYERSNICRVPRN